MWWGEREMKGGKEEGEAVWRQRRSIEFWLWFGRDSVYLNAKDGFGLIWFSFADNLNICA